MSDRRVLRFEDERLLTGRGRFVADVSVPNCAYAAFLRSPHAHARIVSINVNPALALPGVLAALTGQEWRRDRLGRSPILWTITSRDGTPMREVSRPMLAVDVARHVGDTIAVVVAETRAQALDAVEAIVVDYEPLPTVVDAERALEPGAPLLHPEIETNLIFDWEQGSSEPTDRALAGAAHVTTLRLTNSRVTACPMEPRAVLGQYDASTDSYTLWTTTQNPHLVRRWLAEHTLLEPEHKIRVIAPDVGGGFGQKIYHYPEEPIVLWASRILGRPVRWTSTREENFLVDTHARDHVTSASLGLDVDGRIVALQVDTTANLGAYLSPFGACIPTFFYAPMLSGPYAIPNIYCRVKGSYTNTVPVDAYRGAGRPECVYVVERLVDEAARQLGIDPVELRRRNLLPAFNEPVRVATGALYDSGDYPGLFSKLEDRIDYAALRAEQAELRGRGVLMGIGMSCLVECAGAGPSKLIAKAGARMGFWDVASVRVHPSGKVTVFCGSHSHGQGHATTYRQVVAGKLGCAMTDIDIVEGDTDRVPFGLGTWASRSMSVVGAAISNGVDRVVEKGRRLAAHLMECADTDVEFSRATYTVAGTDRKITFREIAAAAYQGADYPEGFELGLEETVFFDPENYNFPAAVHFCVVLIDPDTGVPTIRDYVTVDDVGVMINPMIVEGQVHGGLAQGIGQALLEQCVYEPGGQLLTASFLDYAMPRAQNLPSFVTIPQETPTPYNPLGVKGAGESGTIGAPAAVGNAIFDALSHLGVTELEMPFTPARIWAAMNARARAAQPASEHFEARQAATVA